MRINVREDFAFLDMDGVLVNFVAGACEKLGISDPYGEGSKILGKWNMFQNTGYPEHVHNAWDKSFWAQLPKMHDADAIVKMVVSYFTWDQVVIFSKPSTHPDCIAGKLEWLQKHYPRLSNQFLFGTNKSCSAHPRAVLIDDSDKNVDQFRDAGGRAILYPRSWNTAFRIENEALNALESQLRGYGVYPGGAVAWAAEQVRKSKNYGPGITDSATTLTLRVSDSTANVEEEDEQDE